MPRKAAQHIARGSDLLGGLGDQQIGNAKKAAGRIADLGEPMRRLGKKYL
jgi:hypothetical protein